MRSVASLKAFFNFEHVTYELFDIEQFPTTCSFVKIGVRIYYGKDI